MLQSILNSSSSKRSSTEKTYLFKPPIRVLPTPQFSVNKEIFMRDQNQLFYESPIIKQVMKGNRMNTELHVCHKNPSFEDSIGINSILYSSNKKGILCRKTIPSKSKTKSSFTSNPPVLPYDPLNSIHYSSSRHSNRII